MDSNGTTRPSEDDLYDMFPTGESLGFGPDQGFSTIERLNDPDLFTDAAKEHPAIREFLLAPFSVSFVQFKSSTREAEYFIHKPHRVMGGHVEGVVGSVDRFPSEEPRIGTFVINHDATLAKSIMRALVIEDGAQSGAMIHKQTEPDDSPA